jgi:transcriptional regulator with XRE-family HTH domain
MRPPNGHDAERAQEELRAWLLRGLSKPGKTGEGLAAALGVSSSVVSWMKRGRSRIKPRELMKIAAYLEEPVPITSISEAAQETKDRSMSTVAHKRMLAENVVHLMLALDVTGVRPDGRARMIERIIGLLMTTETGHVRSSK